MDWPQWLTATGAAGAVASAFGIYIKTRPAMAAVELQGEAALWREIAELKVEHRAFGMEVHKLRTQNAALGVSMLDVTLALQAKDAANPALRRAAATLRAAFPADDETPAALAELLSKLDKF